MFSKNFSPCTFISSYRSIRHTRVGLLLRKFHMVLVGKDCWRNEHLVYTYTQCTGLSQNLPFTPPYQKKSLCQKFGKEFQVLGRTGKHQEALGSPLKVIGSTRKHLALLGRKLKEGNHWEALRSTRKHQEALERARKHWEALVSNRKY